MAESKRFEREPAEGSRATVEKQLKEQGNSKDEQQERDTNEHKIEGPTDEHPMGSFPPFSDPAFSSKPPTGNAPQAPPHGDDDDNRKT